MAKLKKFKVDGEAIVLSGFVHPVDGKPRYEVTLRSEFIGTLRSEDLFALAQALSEDADSWNGILHRFPEEQFTYSQLKEFEETWGGKPDGVRMQAAPEE